MNFATMGIKFKWFKHRLDFQTPTFPGEHIPRKNSEDFLSQGVFRKTNNEDGFTEAQKSQTLPPIKIRASNRNSHVKEVSPPPIPTIPPPDFSPIQTNFYHEESRSSGEFTAKTRAFQKRTTSGPKSPQKFGPRMISNEDIQERRQTGLFNEKMDTDNSYIKDYSEGLGMSQRNSMKQAPDLVTSIEEKPASSPGGAPESIRIEKVPMQLGELPEQENDDIFEKIRIPKPEPRAGAPQVQSKRKIGDTDQTKFGTEV